MTALEFIIATHLHQIIGGALLGGAAIIGTKTARKLLKAMRKGYLDVSAVKVKVPIMKFHKNREADEWLGRYDESYEGFMYTGLLRNVTLENVAPVPGNMDQYLFRFIRREWNSYYHPENMQLEPQDIDIRKYAEDGYTMSFSAQQFRRSLFGHDVHVCDIVRQDGHMPPYADITALSLVFNSLYKGLDVDTLHTFLAKVSKHIPVFLTYIDVNGANMNVERLSFIGQFKIYLFCNGRANIIYYPGNDYFNETFQFENLVGCLELEAAAERIGIDVAFRYEENLYWKDHKATYEKLQEQKKNQPEEKPKSMFKLNIPLKKIKAINSRPMLKRQCNHLYPDGRDAFVHDPTTDMYYCQICHDTLSPSAMLMRSTRNAINNGREYNKRYEELKKLARGEQDLTPPAGFSGTVNDWIIGLISDFKNEMAANGKANIDYCVYAPLSRTIKDVLLRQGFLCLKVATWKEIIDAINFGKITYGDVFLYKGMDMMFMVVPYEKAFMFDVHLARKYFFECKQCPFDENFDVTPYRPVWKARLDIDVKPYPNTGNINVDSKHVYYYYDEWMYDSSLNPGDLIMWAPLQKFFKIEASPDWEMINTDLGFDNAAKFKLEYVGEYDDLDAMFERGELDRHPKEDVYHVININSWRYYHGIKEGDLVIDHQKSIFKVMKRES